MMVVVPGGSFPPLSAISCILILVFLGALLLVWISFSLHSFGSLCSPRCVYVMLLINLYTFTVCAVKYFRLTGRLCCTVGNHSSPLICILLYSFLGFSGLLPTVCLLPLWWSLMLSLLLLSLCLYVLPNSVCFLRSSPTTGYFSHRAWFGFLVWFPLVLISLSFF